MISDDKIGWVPYTRDEIICGRYPIDLWHKAVHNIDSDKEFANFMEDVTSVKCYILKELSNNKSIAFLYTLQEDIAGKVVSVHGGGWENPVMYYRGYILMIKHLLYQGLKVRTYCQLSNSAAIRFSRSVGFVPYRYTEDEVFMWINFDKLTKTKLFRRFYPSGCSL